MDQSINQSINNTYWSILDNRSIRLLCGMIEMKNKLDMWKQTNTKNAYQFQTIHIIEWIYVNRFRFKYKWREDHLIVGLHGKIDCCHETSIGLIWNDFVL